MTRSCLIIGASHAAAQLGPTLRQSGWTGSITIIGDEPHIPYHRPPLSKEFLAGKKTLDEILIRPREAYEKAGVHFRTATRVDAIDREQKRVLLSSGEWLHYDRLALTVGSRVRRLDIPGATLEGVHYLRNSADAEMIRADVRPGGRAVVIGGGYIGLEVAAVLRQAGMSVTVLEAMERILQRVTAPPVSVFYQRVHEEEGVEIRCRTGVTALEGNGRVRAVVCGNGETLPADLVVVGVGILPNVELAREAGLEVDNGIVVDEYTRTSDPDIVAAGDCTCHPSRIYGRRIRLESVQNATEQARAAALAICDKEEVYNALPWFWSDQYDLKLQIAGLSQGHDEVILRGSPEAGRSFAVFYLKADRLLAVDAVNKPPEFMVGRRLITEGRSVDKARLADPGVQMRDLMS